MHFNIITHTELGLLCLKSHANHRGSRVSVQNEMFRASSPSSSQNGPLVNCLSTRYQAGFLLVVVVLYVCYGSCQSSDEQA